MVKKDIQKTIFIILIFTFSFFGFLTYPTLGPYLVEINDWSPTRIGLLLTASVVG